MVERWTERLGVVAAGPDAPISTLSGGNQQKVVVARCLVRDPELLVLCEPTAGVDIGTRVAIYDLIAELSRNGLTVVCPPRTPATCSRCAPASSSSGAAGSPPNSAARDSPSTRL